MEICGWLLASLSLSLIAGCGSKKTTPPQVPSPPVAQAEPAKPDQSDKPPGNPSVAAPPGSSANPAAPQGKQPADNAASNANVVNQSPPGNYQVDFSSDGHFAVTGGKNATIRMYDVDKGILTRTFSGQTEPVSAIAFRQDGAMIAAGSDEGHLMVWDARTVDGLDDTEREILGNDERPPILGHSGPIRSLAFRPDGRELASGGEDGMIRYWKLPVTYPEVVWNASSSVTIIRAIPQSNRLIAGKGDGTVELWDLGDSQTIPLLPENGNAVTAIANSEDGNFVAAGDSSGKLRVVDLESRKTILDQPVHEGAITGMRFHPKKSQLLTIGADGVTRSFDLQSSSSGSNQTVLHTFQSKGRLLAVAHGGEFAAVAAANTVEIADLKNKKLLRSLPVDGKEVLSLAWSSEDRTIVAGDSNGGLHAWRIPDGQKIFDSYLHEGAIRAVAGNAEDSTIVSAGADAKIRVWHQPGLPDTIADLGKVDVSLIAASSDGQMIAVGMTDGSIRIVDVDKQTTTANYPGVGKAPVSISWSNDGEWLASGGADGALRVWNVPQGVSSMVAVEAGAPITQVAIHPAGPILIAGLRNGAFKTWRLPFQKSQTLSGHTETITSLAANRSGSRVVTGGNDRLCRLFDVDSGQQVRVFEGAQDGITSVVQSSDGAWIAAGDRSGQISIWQSDSEQMSGVVQGSEGAINKLALDASNKLLASTSGDGLIRIWKPPFNPPVSMKDAAQELAVVAISADGKRIALGLADNSIVIRDTRTGEQIHVLTGHEKPITALGWSGNGEFIVSGSEDTTVRLWSVANGEPLVKWEGHTSPIRAVHVSADADVLRACSADGRFAVYQRTANQQKILSEPKKGTTTVAISPSGKRVALASENGSVQLIDGDTGAKIGQTPPSDAVVALAWCEDDETWVSLDADRTVKFWKSNVLETSRGWPNAPKGLSKLCVSSNASRVLGISSDGRPRLWDAEGHVLQSFAWDSKTSITAIALSPDGQTSVAVGSDGTTSAFSSHLVQVIRAHSGQADFVSFVDEQVLISSGDNSTITSWNLADGRQLRQFTGCPARVIDLAVSKTTSKLLVLAESNKLYAWNLSDGSALELPSFLQDASYRRMGLNADGQRVALLDDQGRFKIVQLSDMTDAGEMTSPAPEVTCMAFLANGTIICAADTLAFISRGDAIDAGTKAHEGSIAGLSLVPNKDEFVTAGEDGKIKVWSINAAPIRTLGDVGSPVRSLAISDDGNELITCSTDNKMKTWSFDGQSIGNWTVGTRLKSLQYTGQSPQTVMTSTENQVRLLQSAKGKPVLVLSIPGKISASALSPQRKVVYAMSTDGTLLRYSIEPVTTADSEQREVDSLAISRNGDSLASGGEDSSVCVWKLPSLKILCRLKEHTKPVTAVEFGRDESIVVSMSSDRSARTWNVNGSKKLLSISIPASAQSLSVSSDGKSIAVTSKEKSVSIYDLQSGKPTQSVSADNTAIVNACFTSKGLMTLDADRRLSVSDTSTVRQFPQQPGPLTAIDVLKDGSYFVTAGPNAGVKLVDFAGKLVGEFDVTKGPIKSISVSSNGQWLAGVNSDGPTPNTAVVWNIADRSVAATISTPVPIRTVQFEPDSEILCLLCEDHKFRRIGAADGALLETVGTTESVRGEPTFTGSGEMLTLESDDRVRLYQPALNHQVEAHKGAVSSLIYSNNGNFLFSGGADGRTVAWDTNTGKQALEFRAGDAAVNDIHVLGNQESLIVTSADNVVRVWPLRRKATEPDFEFRHKAPVVCASTSADSKLMVTGGADKIVHLWLLATGQERELVQFRGHERTVSRVMIAPDNKTILSFGDEDAIRVWKIPDGALTAKSMGQVDISTGMVAVAQPQDKEIDRLMQSISSPLPTVNVSDERQRLRDLRSGRQPSSTQSLTSSDSGTQRIDRDIQNIERKIRSSVGSNKSKLRKELTILKLQKTIANSSGSKQEQARKELEDFQSGKLTNPVLDWETERIPGIDPSDRSIRTDFVFDKLTFHSVKLALSSDKATIAAGRESVVQVGKLPAPGVIQLWDADSGALLRSWREKELPKLSSIVFSQKDKVVFTMPDIAAFQMLSGSSQMLEKNSMLLVSHAEGANLAVLGLTTDLTMQMPILRFYDTDEMTYRPYVVSGYDAKITAMAFSADGKTLYYCERGARQHKLFEMDVQDTANSQLIEEFDHADHWSRAAAGGLGIEVLCVSSDKKYLISYGQYGAGDYRLKTWAKTKDKWEEKPATSIKSQQPILRSADASRIWMIKEKPTVLCFEDSMGRVKAIDLTKGTWLLEKPLKATRWGKPETAHSEDGAWFVWGDDTGKFELWDMRDSKQTIRPVKAHSGPIVGITISDDGERIITAGEENLIKVWGRPTKVETKPTKSDPKKKSKN